MKQVKLTINGKEYSKAEPDIQDWFDNIDVQDKIAEGLNTKEGSMAYFKVVSSYLSIPQAEMMKHGKLSEVTAAYKAINENLLECFGVTDETKNA